MDFASQFDVGLDYEAFLAKYANDVQKRRWDAVYKQIALTGRQKELLTGFTREMQVLVVAGSWCGDCVEQCPIFPHFAAQNELIRLRFFDRDDNPELAEALSICGGQRVPTVLFLSEDGYVCGFYGDRTVSKYRSIATEEFGAVCPTGLVPPEQTLLESVIGDWLDEFERIQLMLRTSGRLRQLHGD